MRYASLFLGWLLIGSSIVLPRIAAAANARPKPSFTGRVVAVPSGDTLVIRDRGRETKVRLYGIDAPDPSQPFSEEATWFLTKSALGEVALAFVKYVGASGDASAVVWLEDLGSLNELSVLNGYAWWQNSEASLAPHLAQAEAHARTNRRGLWSEPHPKPPWAYPPLSEGAGLTGPLRTDNVLALAQAYSGPLGTFAAVGVTMLVLVLTLAKQRDPRLMGISAMALTLVSISAFVGMILMAEIASLNPPPQLALVEFRSLMENGASASLIRDAYRNLSCAPRHYLIASLNIYITAAGFLFSVIVMMKLFSPPGNRLSYGLPLFAMLACGVGGWFWMQLYTSSIGAVDGRQVSACAAYTALTFVVLCLGFGIWYGPLKSLPEVLDTFVMWFGGITFVVVSGLSVFSVGCTAFTFNEPVIPVWVAWYYALASTVPFGMLFGLALVICVFASPVANRMSGGARHRKTIVRRAPNRIARDALLQPTRLRRSTHHAPIRESSRSAQLINQRTLWGGVMVLIAVSVFRAIVKRGSRSG